MRADSAMPVSCTISRHGATPAKLCRAAASTACGGFHCMRTVARLRERPSGIVVHAVQWTAVHNAKLSIVMPRESGARSNPRPLDFIDKAVVTGSSAFADDDIGKIICAFPSKCRPLRAQEVEIAALVGLGHALGVEPRITACRLGGRLPGRAALGQLILVHSKFDTAFAGIERDDIAVTHQCQRAA